MSSYIVPFTGWEPHNTVRAVRQAGQGIVHATIFGREPITTAEVALYGTIVEQRWNKYDRGVTLRTVDHRDFKLGGTNTTSSIALQLVLLEIPGAPPTSPNALFSGSPFVVSTELIIEQISHATLDWLIYTARLSKLTVRLREKLYSQVPHRLSEIAPLIDDANRLFGAIGSNDVWWTDLIRRLSTLVVADPGVNAPMRAHIAQLLGLLAERAVLEPLNTLLRDVDVEVRREAALSFRGMEDLFQQLAKDDPSLRNNCIDGLANALGGDPDPAVRVYVAEDLGYFINQNAVKELIRVLHKGKDEDEHVRWAAAVALGRYDTPSDVFADLVEALSLEPSEIVQRSLMLSLGRMVPQIISRDVDYHRLEREFEVLFSQVTARLNEREHVGLCSYAAYLLGQLAARSIPAIPNLIDSIAVDHAFELRSNATLALLKLVQFYITDDSAREKIEKHLEDNLASERPDQYPASAYFEWFLDHAAELLVKLESRRLACNYYERAAAMFSDTRWRALYYQGLGAYESAEYSFEVGDPAEAIRNLDKAVGLFQAIRDDTGESHLIAEKIKAGVEFRVNMAEARKALIEAVLTWKVPDIEQHAFTGIQNKFSQAFRRYKNILDSDLEEDVPGHRKLSRDEYKLVTALTALPEVGIEAVRLARIYSEGPDDKKFLDQLGKVDVSVEGFSNLGKQTHSRSLKTLAEVLTKDVANSYEISRGGKRPLTAVIGRLILGIQQAFLRPLPTPAIECRLIGPGRADMKVELPGTLMGGGTAENPFIFPSNRRLVFRIVVQVIQRSQNEFLILTDNGQTPRPVNELIHIHEGTIAKTIDYGLMAPAETANSFEFTLAFRNSGCADIAKQETIWVRIYDPFDLTTEAVVSLETEIREKQDTQILLTGELKQLEGAQSHAPSDIGGLLAINEKKEAVEEVNRELAAMKRKYENLRGK